MALLAARTIGEISGQDAEVIRVDGFPGRCRTMTTVSLRSFSFIGTVSIEACLEDTETEPNWFEVGQLVFTKGPSTQGTTLRGKFVFMRFVYDETLGKLDKPIIA